MIWCRFELEGEASYGIVGGKHHTNLPSDYLRDIN
jgi:hypothetical protein